VKLGKGGIFIARIKEKKKSGETGGPALILAAQKRPEKTRKKGGSELLQNSKKSDPGPRQLQPKGKKWG